MVHYSLQVNMNYSAIYTSLLCSRYLVAHKEKIRTSYWVTVPKVYGKISKSSYATTKVYAKITKSSYATTSVLFVKFNLKKFVRKGT